jgi:hypothetical protein
VQVSTLINTPFNIEWGSSIYAKVIATNQYGDSEISDVGNGAIIITYPDAPLNLREDRSIRDSSTLGLLWDEGESNGGNSIT